MPSKRFLAAAVLGLGLLASHARAGTGFQMEAVAEKVVSPGVRGKLIWARASEDKGADPRVWSFLFYDPYADENGRHIVVTDGAVTRIEQGFVEFDDARLLSYKPEEIMPAAKLRVDSDQALARVQAAGHIGSVPLSSIRYELRLSRENDVPVWRLTLYTKENGREHLFCTARVSALTGQIFTLDVDRTKI